MNILTCQRILVKLERHTELPLIVLSLIFAGIIAAPWVAELPPTLEETLDGLEWIIWGIFAADLSVKTYLAESRLAYLRRNWFDVLIVLIPFLRPLRVLRIVRVVATAGVVGFRFRRFFTTHGLHKALAAVLASVAISAGLVTLFERNADGPITGLPDAIWWALATVTTVGYGDVYPTTPQGSGVAVFLMIMGIGLYGVIAANLASFFIVPEEPDRRLPGVGAFGKDREAAGRA